MLQFHDLSIGDVFTWHGSTFIKIVDNPNYNAPLHNQYPNCLKLDNLHYVVCGYNAIVKRIKSRMDFGPEDELEDD